MKNRLYLISPKLKLILSAILLVFSLYFFWSSLHFAVPLQTLAIKKAETEHCLPPGTWALYPPSSNAKPSNAGGWYFSRRGDEFYIARPSKVNFPLWDAATPYCITPLNPFILNFNPIWDTSQENFGLIGSDDMILVTTPDPNVARVELVLNDQTVACTESAPGSGFWVGTVRTKENNRNAILARAYDAGGNLIGITES